MSKEITYHDLPEKMNEEQEQFSLEKAHFRQIPYEEDLASTEQYPEHLDPESFQTWIHQFTAETEIRNYVQTEIKKGNMKIEITQDGNSKAAVIVDPNTWESKSKVYDRSKHQYDAPKIPFKKAVEIINQSFQEKRSLTGTWAHEKRKERNWKKKLTSFKKKEELTTKELEILALEQLAIKSFSTNLGEMLLKTKKQLKKELENQNTQAKSQNQDNIPW